MRVSLGLVTALAIGCVGPPQQLPDKSQAVRVSFIRPITLQLVSYDGDTMVVNNVSSAVGRIRSRNADTLVIAMTSIKVRGSTVDADGRDARFDSSLASSVEVISGYPDRTGLLAGLTIIALTVWLCLLVGRTGN